MGGAIFSLGSLAIFNCQFFTNSAIGGAGASGSPGSPNGGAGAPGGPSRGGGIYSEGTLTFGNTTFAGKLATGRQRRHKYRCLLRQRWQRRFR